MGVDLSCFLNFYKLKRLKCVSYCFFLAIGCCFLPVFLTFFWPHPTLSPFNRATHGIFVRLLIQKVQSVCTSCESVSVAITSLFSNVVPFWWQRRWAAKAIYYLFYARELEIRERWYSFIKFGEGIGRRRRLRRLSLAKIRIWSVHLSDVQFSAFYCYLVLWDNMLLHSEWITAKKE